MTRLQIMERLTGSASASCAADSPRKPPSARDAAAWSSDVSRDDGDDDDDDDGLEAAS